MTPEPLALLRQANPVGVDPEAARSARARAAYEQIVAEPRTPQRRLAWRPRRRGASPARGWRLPLAAGAGGAAGISALIAAILVAALSGTAAAPAFAGWTAQPTPPPAQQISKAIRSCGLTRPTLVDARGPYTAAVFARRSGGTACLEGPSMNFVGSIGGVHAVDNRFKPDQIGIAVATGRDDHGHAFILIAGRVGSAVRSVVIHRRNGGDVDASISHGWYLAWWPAPVRASYASVMTTNGVRQVVLPYSATHRPQTCGGPTSRSCVSLDPGSNGAGSAGVPSPPLAGQLITKPYHRILLLSVYNASRVLVCFHPPADESAALHPHGPTGACAVAALLKRLPPGYPVQQNLLEVFQDAVWSVRVPAGFGSGDARTVLTVAYGRARWSHYQARDELTLGG